MQSQTAYSPRITQQTPTPYSSMQPPPKVNPEDDIDYYAILGIPKDATNAQIKKAYYQKARDFHPDKNADNPLAEQMFKKVSEAYTVLSDEEKRKTYDKFGVAGVRASEQGGGADPGMLIKMLFGCGTFDDIFGDLSFASMLSDPMHDMTEEQMKAQVEQKNKERKEKLVKALLEKIESYEKDQEYKNQEQNIKEKLESVGGPTLLNHISYIYIQEARKNAGRFFGVQGWFAELEEKGHALKQGFSLISSLIKLQAAHSRYEEAAEQSEELAKEVMNHGISMIWKMGLMEIESTVRDVCQMVLDVPDKNTKKARAEALEKLGMVYKHEVKLLKKKGITSNNSNPFSFTTNDGDPQINPNIK